MVPSQAYQFIAALAAFESDLVKNMNHAHSRPEARQPIVPIPDMFPNLRLNIRVNASKRHSSSVSTKMIFKCRSNSGPTASKRKSLYG